jgi:hypothetical protein
MFNFLFKQLRGNPDAVANQRDLAKALRLGNSDKDLVKVRQAAETLRDKLLPKYERQHRHDLIRFELPLKEYRLRLRREAGKRDEPVRLLFQNRSGDWLERFVCKSKGDILHASISSRNSLDDKILRWFERGLVRATHFRVLTWRPSEEYRAGAVAALARQLNLSPKTLQDNMDYAWEKWKGLEEKHEFVEVYGYGPTPTAQATCNDQFIKVELLPLNRPRKQGFHECGDTDNRPGLIISSRQAAYWTFRNWFEDLWIDAMVDTFKHAPSLVAERWREPGLAMLRKRSLLP